MKSTTTFVLSIILICFVSCKTNRIEKTGNSISSKEKKAITVKTEIIPHDTAFVNIKNYSSNFVLDMKYATKDNFLKNKVYDCESCFLRYKTVKSLIEANNEFLFKGYRIKLLDCYRPVDVQKKMWAIVSNPKYVADPAKGSVHNRGGAVDMTIVDRNGKELDMGTPFDFFGPEAGHNYKKLSKKVLNNRLLLKTVMEKHNFLAIDPEWWHYNLVGSKKDNVSNFTWECK
jgi:zinc D-Ala-D-Ala dipeptidase